MLKTQKYLPLFQPKEISFVTMTSLTLFSETLPSFSFLSTLNHLVCVNNFYSSTWLQVSVSERVMCHVPLFHCSITIQATMHWSSEQHRLLVEAVVAKFAIQATPGLPSTQLHFLQWYANVRTSCGQGVVGGLAFTDLSAFVVVMVHLLLFVAALQRR